MKRPLTIGERELCSELLICSGDLPGVNYRNVLRMVLDAEQYWRGEVRDQFEERGGFCLFCNNGDGSRTLREGGNHKTDCPWMLAQQ